MLPQEVQGVDRLLVFQTGESRHETGIVEERLESCDRVGAHLDKLATCFLSR